MDRISIGESVLNRNKIDPFLKWMVTDDDRVVHLMQRQQEMIVIEGL